MTPYNDTRDRSLLPFNTFGIDVRCRRCVYCWNTSDVQELIRTRTTEDDPLLVIGSGSNLLLTGDYPATVAVIGIDELECKRHQDHIDVRVGAGVLWDGLLQIAIDHEWYGPECLALIPGKVGSAAVQNIGAYGYEAKDFITKVEAVETATGDEVEIDPADCQYSYRHSRFKDEWKGRYIITHVHFRFDTQFHTQIRYAGVHRALDEAGIAEPTPQQLRDTVIAIRQAKLPDPEKIGNAGSFFMNPIVPRAKYDDIAAQWPDVPHYDLTDGRVKIPAGWMIEQCGWKGRSLGRAGVYDKQALVLVNLGGATGKEIVALSDAIRHDVREKFGVEIFPEVNIV